MASLKVGPLAWAGGLARGVHSEFEKRQAAQAKNIEIRTKLMTSEGLRVLEERRIERKRLKTRLEELQTRFGIEGTAAAAIARLSEDTYTNWLTSAGDGFRRYEDGLKGVPYLLGSPASEAGRVKALGISYIGKRTEDQPTQEEIINGILGEIPAATTTPQEENLIKTGLNRFAGTLNEAEAARKRTSYLLNVKQGELEALLDTEKLEYAVAPTDVRIDIPLTASQERQEQIDTLRLRREELENRALEEEWNWGQKLTETAFTLPNLNDLTKTKTIEAGSVTNTQMRRMMVSVTDELVLRTKLEALRNLIGTPVLTGPESGRARKIVAEVIIPFMGAGKDGSFLQVLSDFHGTSFSYAGDPTDIGAKLFQKLAILNFSSAHEKGLGQRTNWSQAYEVIVQNEETLIGMTAVQWVESMMGKDFSEVTPEEFTKLYKSIHAPYVKQWLDRYRQAETDAQDDGKAEFLKLTGEKEWTRTSASEVTRTTQPPPEGETPLSNEAFDNISKIDFNQDAQTVETTVIQAAVNIGFGREEITDIITNLNTAGTPLSVDNVVAALRTIERGGEQQPTEPHISTQMIPADVLAIIDTGGEDALRNTPFYGEQTRENRAYLLKLVRNTKRQQEEVIKQQEEEANITKKLNQRLDPNMRGQTMAVLKDQIIRGDVAKDLQKIIDTALTTDTDEEIINWMVTYITDRTLFADDSNKLPIDFNDSTGAKYKQIVRDILQKYLKSNPFR